MTNLSYDILVISRGAEGPGWEILQRPPSVHPSVCPSVHLSVTFSFRTVTQKRIDVFSRCCIVFDIYGMLFDFFMIFLNIEKNKITFFFSIFHVFFAFHAICNIKKNWCKNQFFLISRFMLFSTLKTIFKSSPSLTG